jgi:prevent-host-death family protein
VRTPSEISGDRIYTMRQLSQRTAEILEEINNDERPAMITKNGRFVAMILPVIGADIESTVVSVIVEESEHSQQLTGERTLESLRTTAEVARGLGVSLPGHSDGAA